MPVSGELIGRADPRWEEAIGVCNHDFYHLPAYVTLCAEYEGGEAMAYWERNDSGTALVPLVSRRIATDEEGEVIHLTSPYGYAGPLGNSLDLERFAEACRGVGASTVFLRMHPLLPEPRMGRSEHVQVVSQGETVWIDLTLSEAEMSSQVRSGHRYEIRRLGKLGYDFAVDDWSKYPEFIRLYRETMMRRSAAAYYLFNEGYFAELRRSLAGRLHFFSCLAPDGAVAAASLFVVTAGLMQYHLSGSDPAHSRYAPSKGIIDIARKWGCAEGARVLHLGGGAGAQRDALFEFKAGFSRNRGEFKTVRMVVDVERYQRVKTKCGLTSSIAEDLTATPFPPYSGILTARELVQKT